MTPPRIQLSTSGAPIPSCEGGPQLMPFHIAYSGPAPITTFFRVQELKDDSPISESTREASDAPPGNSGIGSDDVGDGSGSVNNGIEVSKPKPKPKPKVGLGKRLVAAFRGRRVVGVEVPLPEGYAGVVLRSSVGKKPANSSREEDGMNGRSNLRRKLSKRWNRRTRPIELNDEDEATLDTMELDNEDIALHSAEDGREVKTLQATQTFQSIVVWNPDFAVDEGQDEYIRALREWTTMAAEVHRMED